MSGGHLFSADRSKRSSGPLFWNDRSETEKAKRRVESPVSPLEHLRVRPSPVSRVVRCGENKAPTTSFIVVFMEHAYYNGGKLDENFSSFILEG